MGTMIVLLVLLCLALYRAEDKLLLLCWLAEFALLAMLAAAALWLK